MNIVEDELQIIYKHGTPEGIRDKHGYLFLFTSVQRYTGQEERYRQDLERKFKLADYLLEALKKANN